MKSLLQLSEPLFNAGFDGLIEARKNLGYRYAEDNLVTDCRQKIGNSLRVLVPGYRDVSKKPEDLG
jgi:hypothetical protein